MPWLVGVAGYHEEWIAADDRQSRSQMEAGTLKTTDLISVHAGKLSPYGKKDLVLKGKTTGVSFCFLH